MTVRNTHQAKWNDNWFCELSIIGKLLFLYLCENCDIAGFYEMPTRLIAAQIGTTPEEIDKANNELEKSVSHREGIYFVKNYIRYQRNLPLNPSNNCHIGIINRLVKNNELFGGLYEVMFDPKSFSVVKKVLEGSKLGAGKPLVRGSSNGKGNGNIKTIKPNKTWNKEL